MTTVRYIDCTALMQELLAAHPEAAAQIDVFVGDPDRAQLAAMLADAEVAINGHTTMDAELLAGAPRLRSIVFLGSGPSSYIDMAAAERNGVAVHRIVNYGDRAIAEHAFALVMAAARDVAAMDRQVRAGVWSAAEGVELGGKTLGVIGLGGVGREMVRIAAGFGMNVVAWSRGGVDPALPCAAVGLDELLATSDVVSLHLALTPETRGFLSAGRLTRMKPGSVLVNTARGGLVDEAALVEALRSGHLRHAGLDVFDTEPLPNGHPLTALPNVTLTSHAAYKTREATQRLLAAALAIVAAERLRLGSV
ncbi:glycerate dehydrogenase [Alsobacter metallidurans]|uniref:Glycerate dehydrogenase n=1 Tax=Alsobacter metallidurans TaxID=340221 RepID=A0A917MGP7_9HYPH|nr:NAD(P)-dependent oxidoreductase [Alsobacter metallidurans]GGH16424.1 glycerate dehydrogenase [Alsobacter metallidurans]